MEPPENPPEQLRTTADRMSDVSPLVWLMLGIAVVAIFTAMAFGFDDLLNS